MVQDGSSQKAQNKRGHWRVGLDVRIWVIKWLIKEGGIEMQGGENAF